MKHEKAPTVRQAWENTVELVQEDVNETLEELSEVVDQANVILAQMYAENPQEAESFGRDVVRHLNEQWGYLHDMFFVSGVWYQSTLVGSGTAFEAHHVREPAFSKVQSHGFSINMIEIDGVEVPRIGLSFIHPAVPIQSSVLEGSVAPKSFAELHEVTLQYLRPPGTEVVSCIVEEVRESMLLADSLIELITKHKATDFYKLSAAQQQARIDSITDGVESTMPAPESDDVLQTEIDTNFLYLQGYQGGEGLQTLKSNTELKICGRVLGVTAASAIETGFTRPEDCHLVSEGIRLIVQPVKCNFTLEGYNGVFLVPLRHARRIELSMA